MGNEKASQCKQHHDASVAEGATHFVSASHLITSYMTILDQTYKCFATLCLLWGLQRS